MRRLSPNFNRHFETYVSGLRYVVPKKAVELQYPFRTEAVLSVIGAISRSGSSNRCNDGFVQVIQRYRNLFVFDHDRAMCRRPTAEAQNRHKKILADGIVPSDESSPQYYKCDDGSVEVVRERGCRVIPLRDRMYWPALRSVRAKRTSASVEEKKLLDEVIQAANREYGAPVGWQELVRHLMGCHFGNHHIQWFHLTTEPEIRVPYFVVDLDDKSGDPLFWPTSPRKKLVEMLSFLHSTEILSPQRAVMVSSPGGRGRNLYYPLDQPQSAAEVSSTVEAFLDRWHGHFCRVHRGPPLLFSRNHVEVFPTDSPHSTMTALPLGRGSVLCNARGFPCVKGYRQVRCCGDFVANMKPALDALDEARKAPITLDELVRHVPPDEPGLHVVVPAKPKGGDCASSVQAVHRQQEVPLVKGAERVVPPLPVAYVASSDARKYDKSEARRLLVQGLTGPGQRYRAVNCLLRYFCNEGREQGAATKEVQGWLRKYHHRQSRTYLDDPEKTLSEIAKCAMRVFTAVDVPLVEQLRLSVAEVAYIEGVLSRPHGRGTEVTCDWGRLQFSCYFVALVKHFSTCLPNADRERLNLSEGEDRHAVVAASLIAKLPKGKSQPVRKSHCNFMEKVGLITVALKSNRGMATVYAISNMYPLGTPKQRPVDAALMEYLEGGSRWKKYMCEKTWRRRGGHCSQG